MVGRERELEIVERAFADAKRDRVPAIARVCGQSGIGKTLFLSQLARDLKSHGWFVIEASCHTIQQHTPRLVANRIVARALEELGSGSSRYTGGLEESLARFDAGIAQAVGTPSSPQPLDVDAYAFAFLRLFEGIAIDHDVAFLCDDVQWMDDESARALLALPQKVSTGCISLAIAERADAAADRKPLASIDVDLKELEFEESLGIVGAELPELDPQTAAMLAHHAAGHPLELINLCESIRAGQTTDVERSFRSRIAQHLSTLDPELREFIQLCAVLNDPIEERILLQLYPDPTQLERLIERSGRYVSVAASGLEFRHAMLAQSVASTIAVPIPLHKRIITALESLPTRELTDYERIAKHAAAWGDRGTEVEAYLRLADTASAQQAWNVVIVASERALSLCGNDVRKIDFLKKYVLALRAYDREPEAVSFLMGELPLLSRTPQAGLGPLVSVLITMSLELEMIDQATALYRKYAGEVDPLERTSLCIAMKFGALNTADDELFEELDAKLASPERFTTGRVLAFNAAINAGYSSLNGDAEGARELVAAAQTLADPNDRRHMYLLEFAGMMCDFRHIGLKPLSARLPKLNAAIRRLGDISYGNTCEAWEAFLRGDWDGALRAVEDYYREDMPVSRATPLLAVAAQIAALTNGDTNFSKGIENVCFSAFERGFRQSAMQLLPWWLLRNADVALDRFAIDVANDLAVRPPPFSALGYFPAGFALWAAERAHVDVLRHIASLDGTRDRSNWARAHWSLTRGLALQALKSAEAKLHLNEAALSFRTLSAPFFAAYAAHHAGTITAQEKQLLAQLGVTKSKTAAPKRSATDLTRREWEVARLVGDGATNRQIAESLVLSERTVEVHLGNIFGKLDLTSRAQLVRWLFENEGATAPHR